MVTGRRNAWRARLETICLAQVVFLAGVCRTADKNLRAAGGIGGARSFIRADHIHLADVRIEAETRQPAGLDRVAEEVLIQVVLGAN